MLSKQQREVNKLFFFFGKKSKRFESRKGANFQRHGEVRGHRQHLPTDPELGGELAAKQKQNGACKIILHLTQAQTLNGRKQQRQIPNFYFQHSLSPYNNNKNNTTNQNICMNSNKIKRQPRGQRSKLNRVSPGE